MLCSLTQNVVHLIKSIEWFFLFWILLTALHLMFSRFFFNRMIAFANWMITFHGFDGAVIATDKAFKHFRRDLWLLMILNILVIVLIRLI